MENLSKNLGVSEIYNIEKNPQGATGTTGVGTLYVSNNFVFIHMQILIRNNSPSIKGCIPLQYAPKKNHIIRALLIREKNDTTYSSHTGIITTNGDINMYGNSNEGMHEIITIYSLDS